MTSFSCLCTRYAGDNLPDIAQVYQCTSTCSVYRNFFLFRALLILMIPVSYFPRPQAVSRRISTDLMCGKSPQMREGEVCNVCYVCYVCFVLMSCVECCMSVLYCTSLLFYAAVYNALDAQVIAMCLVYYVYFILYLYSRC